MTSWLIDGYCRNLEVNSEINIFEIARSAIMQAYVHALRAWGLFYYMLHTYDMFVSVVCSVILIYLHCANVKCFR